MLGDVKELTRSCILRRAVGALVMFWPLAAVGQDFSGHWESTSPLKVGVLGLSIDLAWGAKVNG
jgi:hypothetical protein